MSRFRKNQAVIVALVLMVVVAGYLNFNSQTASATDPNQQAAEESSEGQFLADGFEEGTLLPVGETSTVSEEANAVTEESQAAEESGGEQATAAEAEAQTGKRVQYRRRPEMICRVPRYWWTAMRSSLNISQKLR